MNCPNCSKPMTPATDAGQTVTVTHTCACGHKHTVTFAQPVTSDDDALSAASKYPKGDRRNTLVTPYLYFNLETTGILFDEMHNSAYQHTRYVEHHTGRIYHLKAYAFEQGNLIHKFMYINNILISAGYRIKHHSDNALFNYCRSSEKAVMYMMAEGENQVKHRAFNALVQRDHEQAYNSYEA